VARRVWSRNLENEEAKARYRVVKNTTTKGCNARKTNSASGWLLKRKLLTRFVLAICRRWHVLYVPPAFIAESYIVYPWFLSAQFLLFVCVIVSLLQGTAGLQFSASCAPVSTLRDVWCVLLSVSAELARRPRQPSSVLSQANKRMSCTKRRCGTGHCVITVTKNGNIVMISHGEFANRCVTGVGFIANWDVSSKI
jgi:hypothetical protein